MTELKLVADDAPQDNARLIEDVVRSADVVVFHSELTDMRAVRRTLDRFDSKRQRLVPMSMGSANARRLFQQLKAMTGWTTSPLIFVNGEFIGGDDELRQYALRRGSAAGWAVAMACVLLIPLILADVVAWRGQGQELSLLGWVVPYLAITAVAAAAAAWAAAAVVEGTERLPEWQPVVFTTTLLAAATACFADGTNAVVAALLAMMAGLATEFGFYRMGALPRWYWSLRMNFAAVGFLLLLPLIVRIW